MYKDKQFDAKKQGIAEVKGRIKDTVSIQYLSRLTNTMTPRQMIITLKEAIGYTNDVVEHLLEKDHSRLIKGPSKTNITKWLSD